MPVTHSSISNRWRAEGGYRELLAVAVPLILSTGAWSIQHFVDRVFLTWYSREALAAGMPAGMLNFTVMSLFLGTAGYVSTFAAQYFGSGRHDRVGPAVWQGVWLAVLAAVAHLTLIPLAPTLFRAIGHEAAVQRNEVVYFQILCVGAFPAVASSALSGFFSGLGRTWPVMWVTVAGTALNLVLDYGMIFGRLGFPEWGMAGAAAATVAASFFQFAVYLILLATPGADREFHTRRGWRPDWRLFKRVLRFGLPSGVQFFLDIAGFTAFLLCIGRLGADALAATNIAFNINTLAFMPMIGFGIGVSVLVGQHLGRNRPDVAERSVWSGFHLTLSYMTAIAALYLLTPGLFVRPFAAHADPREFASIGPTVVVLLRFVALYSVFDTMNIIFASGLKGAGDTRYVMVMIGVLSVSLLVAPSYVVLVWLNGGLYAGWVILTAYVIILGFAFLRRFLGGKWKSMRVIEDTPPTPHIPEATPAELNP